MPEKQYVALKQILLGARTIQPGEDVPIEPFRSYHQMLSLGQIAEKPKGAPASLPDGAHAALLLPDSEAVFVDQEGNPVQVTYHGTQEPDEASRETLELEPGQLAALVTFPEAPEPSLVDLNSLLWGSAASRLVLNVQEAETTHWQLSAQLGAATEAIKGTGSLQTQIDWLELMLKAVQTPGEPLADTQVGGKELAAAGITTQAGLRLLASGEQALQNLIRLEGIGKKTAERILDGLTLTESPEPADTPPDPASTPPEG